MRGLRQLILILFAVAVLSGLPVLADDGQTSAVFGQSFELEAGERLGNDLMAFGGTVDLAADSVVDGNVTVFGGETTINGRVDGDVVAVGGVVELGASSEIEGDLVAFGSVRRATGAVVRGNTVEGIDALARVQSLRMPQELGPLPGPGASASLEGPGRDVGAAADLGRGAGTLVVALVLALVVAAVLPAPLERTVQVMRTNWALSLVVGLLTVVVVGMLGAVFALLVLVCVGLPLLLVLGVAALAAAVMGWTAVGRLVGSLLTRWLRLANTNLLVETVIGTAAITLASMIPCVGTLAGLVALCWGVGAAVMANVGALQHLPSQYAWATRPWQSAPGASPRKGDTTRLSDRERTFSLDDEPSESQSPAGS